MIRVSPVAKRFCAQNWWTGGAGFYSWTGLSTLPLGVFRGFIRNSCKYELGSLRKDAPPLPKEGIVPQGGHPPLAHVQHADYSPYPYNQMISNVLNLKISNFFLQHFTCYTNKFICKRTFYFSNEIYLLTNRNEVRTKDI